MENDPINPPAPQDPVEAWLCSQVSRPSVPDAGFSARVLVRVHAAREAERAPQKWSRAAWVLGLGSVVATVAASLLPPVSSPTAAPLHSGAGQLLLLGAAALLYSHRHYVTGPLRLAARALASIRLSY